MNQRPTYQSFPLSLLLAAWLGAAGYATAQSTQIDWASTVVSSTAADASLALGRPDGVTMAGNQVGTGTHTFGGFGSGDNISYNSGALASLLGVSPATLARADFLVFERNGTPGVTFESCTWTFGDGTSQLVVPHTFGGSAAGPILALGNVSDSAYASFFGATVPAGGDWPYMLIDIDGFSAVNPSAGGFQVTLSTPGGSNGTPEPDALGRITPVPEPSTWAMMLSGLMFVLWRRRGAAAL